MKFRKKPVVIDAMQFEPLRSKDVAEWCGGTIRQTGGLLNNRTVIDIHTLEGTMRAEKWDWIIKGVKGEFYPCKPEIFEATYEPVIE